jgi:dimethylglycine dehydrogenase
MAPAYSEMTEAGCRWGAAGGWRCRSISRRKGFVEKPSLKRSNAHDWWPRNARRCARRGPSGYLRLLPLRGVGAERGKAWLDRILATKLPGPGRARLAPCWAMKALKGDLTCSTGAMAPGGSWAAYYLREWHMRWFHDHMADGVTVRDLGDQMAGFSPAGPKSRAVIEKLTDGPGGRVALHGLRRVRHRADRCKVGGMSVSGRARLRNPLQRDGAHRAAPRRCWRPARRRHSRVRVQRAPRCGWRRAFGIWSREFTQGYTAGETGMDRWIDWHKPDFIGRDAALKPSGTATDRARRSLVTLEVDADDADASGFEPVWADGKLGGVHHLGRLWPHAWASRLPWRWWIAHAPAKASS